MTLFLQSTWTELTTLVLQKFYEILWCEIEPFRLANWTKKVFPVFPRNIQYRARLKSPLFHFFRHCETFFLQRVPLSMFLILGDRKDVQKSQSVPPFSFFSIVRLFSKKILKGSPLHFFDVLQQWLLENPKGSRF